MPVLHPFHKFAFIEGSLHHARRINVRPRHGLLLLLRWHVRYLLLHGTHVGLLLPRIVVRHHLILHKGGRLGSTWVHHWIETRRHWTGHVLRRHNVRMNRCFLIPGIWRFLHCQRGVGEVLVGGRLSKVFNLNLKKTWKRKARKSKDQIKSNEMRSLITLWPFLIG